MRAQLHPIGFGKHVAQRLYLHAGYLGLLPESVQERVRVAVTPDELALEQGLVIKLCLHSGALSVLHYPAFWTDGFPTLASALSVPEPGSHATPRLLTFSGSDRPVLHRKELLISPEHPEAERFAELTLAAEHEGLFQDSSRIGRERYWSELLTGKGLRVDGHTLMRRDGSVVRPRRPGEAIARHLTALCRQQLSVPIQQLLRFGLLRQDITLFDYGCGQGDDLRFLGELGYTAAGWDPHFHPATPKLPADVVNLGYVLNVIEDPEERVGVLREAFDLAKGLLVVSALVGRAPYRTDVQVHGDGYLTRRNTFQKYFQQDELRALLERHLNASIHPVAPGIVFAFRDEALEQHYLLQRTARRRTSANVVARTVDLAALSEEQLAVTERFWDSCLSYGRPPHSSELGEHDDIRPIFGRVDAAINGLLGEPARRTELNVAATQRREDLVVEFALAEFERRVYFKYFDDSLKRDIRYHFDNYSNLRAAALELLRTLPDTSKIAEYCIQASQDGLGFAFGEHALMLHSSVLDRLPALLRGYVGCAQRLCGDAEQCDLIKLHMHTGKVSFLSYDDFEDKAVPDLVERIKVNLWHRRVEYFDYVGEFEPQPLLFKSLYLPQHFENFEAQERFDSALMRTRLFRAGDRGPSRSTFYGNLRDNGYRVEGFELVRAA